MDESPFENIRDKEEILKYDTKYRYIYKNDNGGYVILDNNFLSILR